MTVPTNSSPPSGFMANILQEVCNRGGFNVSFMQVNGSLYSSDDDLLFQNLPFSPTPCNGGFSSKILDESPVLVTSQTISSEATLNLWSFLLLIYNIFYYLLYTLHSCVRSRT